MTKVRVKKLEWKDETAKYSYPHRYRAETPCGSGDYSVAGSKSKDEWQWFRNGNFVAGHYGHKPMPLEEAMQCAQNDYERRILAGVEA